jgi:type II secretory pathway pseudopilin PulG
VNRSCWRIRDRRYASVASTGGAPVLARLVGPRRNGVTFVEVLATLLLVAIVLPVVMKGISLSTTTASKARERTEVAALAENRLAEIAVSGEWRVGLSRGSFAPEHPEYQWALEVRDWTEPGLQQLTLYVEDAVRGETVVSMSTLVRGGGRR